MPAAPHSPLFTRGRVIAVGLLVAALAAAPFVPRGGSDEPTAVQSAAQPPLDLRHAEVGFGRVSPAARAEIAAVVARTSALPLRRMSTARAAATLPSCAVFEGQTYCLGLGWTQESPAALSRQYAAAARLALAHPHPGRTTGDLGVLGQLARTMAMPPSARAAAARAELTQAARSVAKVWLLRHEIQGVPLPAGFLTAHPEVQAPVLTGGLTRLPVTSPSTSPAPSAAGSTTGQVQLAGATSVTTTTPPAFGGPTPSPIVVTSTVAAASTTTSAATPAPTATVSATPAAKTYSSYPQAATVLDKSETADQTRYYYCGPTSMQMIAWGWTHQQQSQEYWASKLHTTSSGTGISDMVRVTNDYTGWDNKAHAGPYVVLDVKGFTFRQWRLLIMRHVADYQAPVIFHPILLKRYYPYIDHDLSGHFQVGRGYNKLHAKPDKVSYFEPYNAQRFDPSMPFIGRVQWRNAYRSYRGNEAHFQHNIGV